MTDPRPEATYELYISYDPDTDSLPASLEFLSKVVSNHSKADRLLADCLGVGLKPKIVLDDIQKSSIRLFIKNVVLNTKEDQIQDKGFKAFFNQFLVEARKPFLKYASNNDTLEDRGDLTGLRNDVAQIATDNNLDPVPIESMSDESIAKCLSDYSVPAGLGKEQEYKAICVEEEFSVRRTFKVTSEQISEVVSAGEHTLKNQTVYLKPKTAVYEGEGMWDFHVPNSRATVHGKILDETWLGRFQRGELSPDEYPFPGTVLRARADIVVRMDESNFKRSETYHIHEIFGPLTAEELQQIDIEDIIGVSVESEE